MSKFVPTNGGRLRADAQRWSWGWRHQHSKSCGKITAWWSFAVNRSYRA